MKIATGPRVGVSSAAEVPWRFWFEGDPTVSAYRAHVPRRSPTPGGPIPPTPGYLLGTGRWHHAGVDDIIDELSWRGLLADTTDIGELRSALKSGRVTFYAGFDPTAPGLHIGNLALLLTMRRCSWPGTGRSGWSAGLPG